MKAFEELRLFVHLSQTLHFGRTSRECHISPSALSRTIQRLERELGVALLARDRRNVTLTAEGKRFQAFAAETIERWERFDRDLHDANDVSGRLAVFCTVTAAQSFMPEILERFRARYPDVHIQLETGYAGDALAMLKEGVDVTVPALPERLPSSIESRVITVTPLVFVAPTGLDRVTWDDVPLIVPPAGVTRDAVDRWFRHRGTAPNVYSEVASHEAILSLVASGCGVGVVPALVLERSSLGDQLHAVAVRPRLGDLRVGACVLRRRLVEPVISAMWSTIADFAA